MFENVDNYMMAFYTLCAKKPAAHESYLLSKNSLITIGVSKLSSSASVPFSLNNMLNNFVHATLKIAKSLQ